MYGGNSISLGEPASSTSQPPRWPPPTWKFGLTCVERWTT